MSFTVQLYDGEGAAPICVNAMERELKDKLNLRNYAIERFNGYSVRKLADRNPMAIVIPGGFAVAMTDELFKLSDQIKEVVECDFGAGVYLSCAGAIIAANYITGLPPFYAQQTRTKLEVDTVYLNLHDAETYFPYYTPDKSKNARQSPLNCTTILTHHSAEGISGAHRFYHASGPGFRVTHENRNYKVIATYGVEGNLSGAPLSATILKMRDHDYLVPPKPILATGIHPEIGVDDIVHEKEVLSKDGHQAHYESLKAEMETSELIRHQVLRHYFELIGLEVRK